MATSSVARNMLRLWSLVFLALANAQSISPSNSTLADNQIVAESILTTSETKASHNLSYTLAPLTAAAGIDQSDTALSTINYSGNLSQATAQNQSDSGTGNIVFVSCDPTGGFLDPSDVVTDVVKNNPTAIILYSVYSDFCTLTGDFNYGSLFTLASLKDSQSLYENVLTFDAPTQNVVSIGPSNSTSTSSTSATNPGGPAPTTAVAMSILYSITGIITLLFLVIIATGAVRAHRHPERYGPRTGNLGRPRQSRAKGLARAMLETLPIVKFGDPEPVKPGESRDIELEDGASGHTPETTAVPEAAGANGDRAIDAIPETAVVASGMNESAQETSVHSGGSVPAAVQEGELGCSICTEDFAKGEDVRVLPCGHKYHPNCVDPWLLNVSGTCPLCRRDLRPTPSATNGENPAEGGELPPPLSAEESAAYAQDEATEAVAAPPQRSRRMSRFFDLNHLRTAPADERIAALRRLREQSQQDGGGGASAVEDEGETSRRGRLTARLRGAFRGRGQSEAPAQAEPRV